MPLTLALHPVEAMVPEAETALDGTTLRVNLDELRRQLENNPSLLKRIAPVTLGAEPDDPNAIYPKARVRDLIIARKTLLEQAEQESTAPQAPPWLERLRDPRRRISLFIAGAGLVLISLVFFTSRAAERRAIQRSATA